MSSIKSKFINNILWIKYLHLIKPSKTSFSIQYIFILTVLFVFNNALNTFYQELYWTQMFTNWNWTQTIDTPSTVPLDSALPACVVDILFI